MINKFFVIFIAIVFICCVFAYGSNDRFSLEKWIDNIVLIADGESRRDATIEDVSDCWTKDYYMRWVNDNARVQTYYEEYEGDNEVLEWLDSVVGFFKRLFRTIKLSVEIAFRYVTKLPYLLPWNATVPIT